MYISMVDSGTSAQALLTAFLVMRDKDTVLQSGLSWIYQYPLESEVMV